MNIAGCNQETYPMINNWLKIQITNKAEHNIDAFLAKVLFLNIIIAVNRHEPPTTVNRNNDGIKYVLKGL